MQRDIEVWNPWHPRDFARAWMPTFIGSLPVGGRSISSWVRTRDHEDLEVAVASSFFETLPPRVPDFDFWVPQGEGKLAPMSVETLTAESHQTWAYERAAQVWRFDVFREQHDGDTWICRRDTSIRRRYPEVFEMSADGIPYLRPEICLLFEAKAVRDKDRADFKAALPGMSLAQRAWLHAALRRVHPDHD
jgi:hypothetical protein